MSVSSIGGAMPYLNTAPQNQEQSPLERAAREALKNAPAEKARPEADKAQSAQRVLADTVNISPEGQAAAKALFAALNGLRPAETEPEAEADGAENRETPKSGGSPAAENDKAPADEKAADGAPGEGGGGGGGGEGSDLMAEKLKKLKEEKRELEKEIEKLKRQTGDEAAKEEIEAKTAEKQQVEGRIKALEQQMKAQ